MLGALELSITRSIQVQNVVVISPRQPRPNYCIRELSKDSSPIISDLVFWNKEDSNTVYGNEYIAAFFFPTKLKGCPSWWPPQPMAAPALVVTVSFPSDTPGQSNRSQPELELYIYNPANSLSFFLSLPPPQTLTIALNSQMADSCLGLQTTKIKEVHHHIQQQPGNSNTTELLHMATRRHRQARMLLPAPL